MSKIKSEELCERCVFEPWGCEECEGCEQHVPYDDGGVYCKCWFIPSGTPCPYFKEASDE